MSRKVTYEEVAQLFTDHGCVLLSQAYVKAKDKLEFICLCGRRSSICYDKFRAGQLCGGCRFERGLVKRRHTYEHIAAVFEAAGCVLLSESYSSNKQKLAYQCVCGNTAEIAFAKFQAGQRCTECKRKTISAKLTGPNNPAWRHDLTDEDRAKERTIPGYADWRRAVFARDEYTCIACGDKGGRLNAHHIEGYARVPEKRTDVDNGATLCAECHDEYHRKIRHADGDSGSFEYFLTDYRDPWYAGEPKERDEEEEAA